MLTCKGIWSFTFQNFKTSALSSCILSRVKGIVSREGHDMTRRVIAICIIDNVGLTLYDLSHQR